MRDSQLINCIECKGSAKCFKRLIPSEIDFINQYKTHISYRKGENICKQGAFASYVIYILDGIVKLYLESPNNKNVNLKILQSSEFIGLSSIYGDNVYNYSAIALKDSSICLIEKNSIKQLLNNNGNFASEIIKWYCKEEEQLYNKIQSLSNKQMHGRLADTLLYLCDKDIFNNQIFSYLSRKDIAEFAGLSTESTVRLLTEFKNEGIIDIDGKKIKITNPEILKKISDKG
jgi:CRP-like cAMP-binding protein